MRESLQRLCDDFIANHAVVKRQFGLESSYIYPVCANMFCARGVPARAESLAACKALLKQKTGVFSNFRGNLTAPISCMLAAGPSPEARMDQALANYTALKEHFWGSEYLALAAFLLADMGIGQRAADKIARGKDLYDRMKKEHPFLTSGEDSVFAVLMAFSDKSDDALIADMESCYTLLKKRFSSSNDVQAMSHVLALAAGDPAEKTARLIELFDAIHAAGGKYGRHYELATLAAVSILEADLSQIVEDMLAVDGFLSGQKGYGFFAMDRKTRMMHAAMLVSDEYCARDTAFTALLTGSLSEMASQTAAQNAIMTSTMAMLAAQQAAMCAMMTSAAASSASTSGN